MNRAYELKMLPFHSTPLLLRFLRDGAAFQGFSPSTVLMIVAIRGSGGKDWAVYADIVLDPYLVINWGMKLPRETAEALFPHWKSDLGLEYRL